MLRNETPGIQTERLVLDLLGPEDAEAMFAYRCLPEVSRYQGFSPKTLAEVVAFIERNLAAEFGAPDSWFQLALRHRTRGDLIGDVGLHFVGEQQFEFGITVAPSDQGEGLGGEAAAALVRFAFEQRCVHRVFASIDPRNAPSEKMLRRLGFRHEALMRQALFFKGEWVDDSIFALLRAEWREKFEQDWIQIEVLTS